MRKQDITGVTIRLNAAGKPVLLIHLGADGSITRMGTGAVENEEGALFMGSTDTGIFQALLADVDDDMLTKAGTFTARHQKGDPCELSVIFSGPSEGAVYEFQYGSESEGPPQELRDLVIRALELTEPWYEEQKAVRP
jgi:hypothetical protein